MNISLYARISTSDKGQDSDNQLLQLRTFAALQGWRIVREYVDEGISGSTDVRPAFQEMFKAAERHEFELLLFWSLDRLSRQGVLETLQHLQRLTAAGVAYRSYTEQYLDSCGIFRDVIVSLMATLAKQEKLRIGERTKAGMKVAAAKGVHCGRPRKGVVYLPHQRGKSSRSK